MVGETVVAIGFAVGAVVGGTVVANGAAVGLAVGKLLAATGAVEVAVDGPAVIFAIDGGTVGPAVGVFVFAMNGDPVGLYVGAVDLADGFNVGFAVGFFGFLVGLSVGTITADILQLPYPN